MVTQSVESFRIQPRPQGVAFRVPGRERTHILFPFFTRTGFILNSSGVTKLGAT